MPARPGAYHRRARPAPTVAVGGSDAFSRCPTGIDLYVAQELGSAPYPDLDVHQPGRDRELLAEMNSRWRVLRGDPGGRRSGHRRTVRQTPPRRAGWLRVLPAPRRLRNERHPTHPLSPVMVPRRCSTGRSWRHAVRVLPGPPAAAVGRTRKSLPVTERSARCGTACSGPSGSGWTWDGQAGELGGGCSPSRAWEQPQT